MENRGVNLREACTELEELIKKNKNHLDSAQEHLETLDPGTNIPRSDIEKATEVAALESMKHTLATLKGGLKASDCHYACKHLVCIQVWFSPD